MTVSNINDENPIFQTASRDQSISLPESSVGIIMTMNAIDTDGPLSVPTTFIYSIVYGNNLIGGSHSFSIDSLSGKFLSKYCIFGVIFLMVQKIVYNKLVQLVDDFNGVLGASHSHLLMSQSIFSPFKLIKIMH